MPKISHLGTFRACVQIQRKPLLENRCSLSPPQRRGATASPLVDISSTSRNKTALQNLYSAWLGCVCGWAWRRASPGKDAHRPRGSKAWRLGRGGAAFLRAALGPCGKWCGRSRRHQDPGGTAAGRRRTGPGPRGCGRRRWARRSERGPEMPSKKKKYNARFPPVSTWPGWASAGWAPGRLGPRSCWWGGGCL